MTPYISDPLLIAFDSDGALRHVNSVPNGAACGCVCPACRQPLVAKNGGAKLIHHFAHKRADCKWGLEASITVTVESIIREERRLNVQGAQYIEWIRGGERRLPPDGELSVISVERSLLDGRSAPVLRIEAEDPSGARSAFLLAASIAHPIGAELADALREAGGMLLVFDIRSAYRAAREEEGRHFSRADFLVKAQDPGWLRAQLLSGSDLLDWAVHPERDRAAEEAERFFNWYCGEQTKKFLLRREWRFAHEDAFGLAGDGEAWDAERERRWFVAQGVIPLRWGRGRDGSGYAVAECPLHGRADLVLDCGSYEGSTDHCPYFQGEGNVYIGCSALPR